MRLKSFCEWVLVAFIGLPLATHAWQARVTPGEGSYWSVSNSNVAAFADGNVVVAGTMRQDFYSGYTDYHQVVAIKLSPDGSEVWRYIFPAGELLSLAIDAQGDVVIGGRIQWSNEPHPTGFDPEGPFTIKLDGNTGLEKWRRNGFGLYARVGSEGDIFATGPEAINEPGTICKVSGDSGEVLWSRPTGLARVTLATGVANVVEAATDGGLGIRVKTFSMNNGDLIWDRYLPQEFLEALSVDASDSVRTLSRRFDGDLIEWVTQVHKLAPETGIPTWSAELWRAPNPTCGRADCVRGSLAYHASGDLLVGYELNTGGCDSSCDSHVARLADDTGQERWHVVVPGNLTTLVADVNGDPIVVTPGVTATVTKLSGMDGSIVWQHTLHSQDGPGISASDVAPLQNGNLVIAGAQKPHTPSDPSVPWQLFAASLSGDWEDLPANCGNGVLDLFEECDDGNNVDGDICPSFSSNGCQYVATAGLARGSTKHPSRDRSGCQVEWYVLNPNNPRDKHNLPNLAQSCADGDPSCDFNPANGWCGFEVVACVNNRDPNLHACAANGVDAIELKSPRLRRVTSPEIAVFNANRAAIENALTHLADPLSPQEGFAKSAPITAEQKNLCSEPFRIDVPMALAIGRSRFAGIKVKTKSVRSIAGSVLKHSSQLKFVCRAQS